MLKKENVDLLGKFKICLLLLSYVIIVILSVLTLTIKPLPLWYYFGVYIPFGCLMLVYIFYLDYCIQKKKEFLEEEHDSILEQASESAKIIVKSNLDIIKELEPKLKRLKEKCSKSSNPFLIRKYLRMKLDFEYACLQIEAFSEYLNKPLINQLIRLKESGFYDDRMIDDIKD